jgi:hypothetical protein
MINIKKKLLYLLKKNTKSIKNKLIHYNNHHLTLFYNNDWNKLWSIAPIISKSILEIQNISMWSIQKINIYKPITINNNKIKILYSPHVHNLPSPWETFLFNG